MNERVAVVTGANRGMGLETARQLAKRGMQVVGTARDAGRGEAAAAALAGQGLEVRFRVVDVTDAATIADLARYLDQTHGRLDVLVNNAGAVFEPRGPGAATGFFDLAPDVIRRSFETNTMGAVSCCRALVPLMQKHGYGRIVNVSSGMGALHDMGPGMTGYRLSKAALNAFTRTLSQELKGQGIKVNAVCPGHVQTELGGADAPRTVEEGVDTTLWLATLRDDGPTGGFFRDCKQIDW